MTVIVRRQSATWATADADVSVVVATHNRVAFLPELVAALERQEGVAVEVVLVDDGSTDGTAAALDALTQTTVLPLLALSISATGGPSEPRNTGAREIRSPYLLFTDDDCLPTPRWAATLRSALVEGATVVQGRTVPPPGTTGGRWDRTIWVEQPGPLYETCNIGYRRDTFDAVGGFPSLKLLDTADARGFGEDAVAGARAAAAGRSGWAPDAEVHHRWLPGSFRQHLRGRRRLAAMPALAKASSEVDAALTLGMFLSRRTAEFDLAVIGSALAAGVRTPWPVLLAAPWLVQTVRAARRLQEGSTALGVVQLAVADGVSLLALLRGSLRSRKLVV